MGIVNSVDTRRISFDNNIISTPALIQNLPMGDTSDDDDLLHIDPLGSDNDFNIKDDKKSSDKSNPQEGGDTEYWSQRLETLKKEHQLINKIVETEFEKTVESVRKNYESPNTLTIEKIKKVKPCLDWRQKMMKCYEQNPHQPLVCSGTVQAFAECVSSCRAPEI